MSFVFSNENIRENRLVFIYEESIFPGVGKIAGKVREDIGNVFSAKPIGVNYADYPDTASFFSYPVFFGTVGRSAILDKLAKRGFIDLFRVAKEREVYSLTVVDGLELDGFKFESAIVIAGSDKRGTIYGLFKLSEMLGVSPFTGWLEAKPEKMEVFELNRQDSVVSKTPSVKYRGIFINDEWPAFGTWCNKRFGGFNATMYEHVFELILRLKGNYLWPAMWSAIFPDDGPGDANCVLADELGIVMGCSHHEPCMRQGEEYKHLRGPESVYGDAWDFRTNREGITKFWEDGLKKRAAFENVYTVGMRGEADSKILDENATLEDNISLLRDVLKTQNRLISEILGKDISEVPRLLALYKEVEPFYYGDGKTQGLANAPELDGVTIMYCDDNFGNLRTVPQPSQRDHKGGFGMYYHMDYHGLPVSYEWFNTSYLPKVWEQMSSAYDHGIRDVWIVNVGDIFTNEYPLAFFMDMAYDFDRWGTSNPSAPKEYTKMLVDMNFRALGEVQRSEISRLLLGYTRLLSARRTEACSEDFEAGPYARSDKLIGEIEVLTDSAAGLYKSVGPVYEDLFYELVYLPLCATLNVMKMWLLTGMNHMYAGMGSTAANTVADMIKDCIKTDRKLIKHLHRFKKGKWYGMGLSEHIGFRHWCDEECRYPVVHTFEPSDKARLIVSIPETGQYTEGGFWSGKTLVMTAALYPPVCGGYIELSNAGSEKAAFTMSTEDDFIEIIEKEKSVKCGQVKRVFIMADRMKLEGKEFATGTVLITFGDRTVKISVPIYNPMPDGEERYTHVFFGEGQKYDRPIVIPADDFTEKNDTESGRFCILEDYGPQFGAVKAYPQNETFTPQKAPYITYRLVAKEAVKVKAVLYTSPANPCYSDNKLVFAYALSSFDFKEVNMVSEDYAVGDGQECWEKGVIDNFRTKEIKLGLKKGDNDLRIGARSPGFVLEKIVIMPDTD